METRKKNEADILRPFLIQTEAPAVERTSCSKCPQCDNLEREYQHSVDEICSVVRTRFPSLSAKIQDLHKWQDSRDKALAIFYQHKSSHIRRAA